MRENANQGKEDNITMQCGLYEMLGRWYSKKQTLVAWVCVYVVARGNRMLHTHVV